jgi:hypothetical protein
VIDFSVTFGSGFFNQPIDIARRCSDLKGVEGSGRLSASFHVSMVMRLISDGERIQMLLKSSREIGFVLLTRVWTFGT